MESLAEDIKGCARLINEIGRAFSTFDLLDYVRFTQSVVDLNTYQESNHPGSLPLVEIVALALTAQPAAAAGDSSPIAQQLTTFDAVRQTLRFGYRIMDMIAAHRLLAAQHEGASRDWLASLARDRELFMRTPTHEPIAEHTLDELLGTSPTEQMFRHELGFTAREACDLFQAIRVRCSASAPQILARLEKFTGHIDSDPPVSGVSWIWNLDKVPDRAVAELHELFDSIWLPIPDESTFGPEDLADESGLTLETVRAFLAVFEQGPAAADAGDVVSDAISGPSPLRTRPILRDAQGRRFLVHGGIGIHAVREALEAGLKKPSRNWNEYSDRRGAYLERKTLKHLSKILPGAQVRGTFKYFGPRPGSNEAAGKPANYTTLFESDGLLVIDDIALIVEAKAGSLRPQGRSGDPRQLEQGLRKLVKEASAQAERLHRLILRDGGIRLKDKKWCAQHFSQRGVRPSPEALQAVRASGPA